MTHGNSKGILGLAPGALMVILRGSEMLLFSLHQLTFRFPEITFNQALLLRCKIADQLALRKNLHILRGETEVGLDTIPGNRKSELV